MTITRNLAMQTQTNLFLTSLPKPAAGFPQQQYLHMAQHPVCVVDPGCTSVDLRGEQLQAASADRNEK